MVEFLQQVRSYEVSTISKEYVKRVALSTLCDARGASAVL